MRETSNITRGGSSANKRFFKGQNKNFHKPGTSQLWESVGWGSLATVKHSHSENTRPSGPELWEREFMQLHHIDLWETEERWGEDGN